MAVAHAVLARPGFSDHARLAHAPRQQPLPDRIVHLVGAGVTQVLALEQDLTTQRLGQALGGGQGCRSPDLVAQQLGQLATERNVGAGGGVGGLELDEGTVERLWNEAPSVGPESTRRIGALDRLERGGWIESRLHRATAG